jgi:hypothetical protein
MESGVRNLTSSDLSDVTTTKLEVYGTIGMTNDGRRFRYVQFGGAVVVGNLVVAAPLVANHQNIAVQAAAPQGSFSVQVTLGATAATQDQYAGGFLVIGVDGSGVPYTRKIKGNTLGASGAVITVTLAGSEPLLAALTTTNVVSLSPSPYNGVIASSTASAPVGVALQSAASGSYGYVQTFGPCGVVNDAAGALTALGPLKQSTTVAGSVAASSAATDIQIGYIIQGAAASKAFLAFLNRD